MAITDTINRKNWLDYLSLTKPRVVCLHLITASAAMFLAGGKLLPPTVFIFTLLGGGLVTAAANVINCYLDRDLDRTMNRTYKRPLPAGRLHPFDALLVSSTTGMSGLFILSYYVSPVAALLALGALAYYILIYTWWLKRRTWWSSIVGSGAGAFPPLIGWVAVTGQIDVIPFLLFGIIAFWTPPHFWALAIFRCNEYEMAGVRVIPRRNVSIWVSFFSILLTTLSLLLAPLAGLGLGYLITATMLGIILLRLSFGLHTHEASKSSRQLYFYSIIYLLVLFVAISVEKLV